MVLIRPQLICGNTFPAVVFSSFGELPKTRFASYSWTTSSNKYPPGAFWLTYAVTLQDGVYGIVKGYPNQAAFMNEFGKLSTPRVICTPSFISTNKTNPP